MRGTLHTLVIMATLNPSRSFLDEESPLSNLLKTLKKTPKTWEDALESSLRFLHGLSKFKMSKSGILTLQISKRIA
jgi:hypothetical protein